MSRKSNREIWKNGKKFIPLNIASVSSGFHREYLRQLIKNGKLVGERIGSSWFIAEDVFSNFIKNNPTNGSHYSNGNIENKFTTLEKKLEKIANDLNYVKDKNTSNFTSNKTDPWDTLLLGEDHIPTKKFNSSKFHLAEFVSNLLAFKISIGKIFIILFLIFVLSGFFILKYPEVAIAGLNGAKNTAEQLVRQTLAVNQAVLGEIIDLKNSAQNIAAKSVSNTAAIFENAAETITNLGYGLASAFKQNYISLSSSISSLRPRLLSLAHQSSQSLVSSLSDFKSLNPAFLENSILNLGKYVGWRISQNKDPIKTAKSVFNSVLEKLSGL
ncbi:MAG: hypothetical protein AAB474_01500, partial [Patescibacteria group bacterium]